MPTVTVGFGVKLDLQAQIESAEWGGVIEIAPGEYVGPFVLRKALTLRGGPGTTLQSPVGPVVVVDGPGVVLENLIVEVSASPMAPGPEGCALQVRSGYEPITRNVEVRGSVIGSPAEEGVWNLPPVLEFKTVTAISGIKTIKKFRFAVPAPCTLVPRIDGLEVTPDSLSPGTHEIELGLLVDPGANVLGVLRVCTPLVWRKVQVTAFSPFGGAPRRPLPPPPRPKAPVVAQFVVEPASIWRGQSCTLRWEVTGDTTNISINQGIGTVRNTDNQWVSPNDSTTYTLTATGPGGTVTAAATVTVTAPSLPPPPLLPTTPPPLAPVVAQFVAESASIRLGQYSTLRWEVTGDTTNVSINRGIGPVGSTGNRRVQPKGSATYTLTATGPGGSVTAAAKVRVTAPPPEPPIPPPPPPRPPAWLKFILAGLVVVVLAGGAYWALSPGDFSIKLLTALPRVSGMTPVTALAFSPDGKILAEGTADNAVRLFDAASGEPRWRLARHDGPVRAVAFSADGRKAASGGDDMKVVFYDVAKGEFDVGRGPTMGVLSLAFSPDGASLAAGMKDSTVLIWDAAKGQVLQTLRRHDGAVNAVAYSPDGAVMVSGGEDNKIAVWDINTGQYRDVLRGHDGGLLAIAAARNGKMVAAGFSDGTVRIWKQGNSTPEYTLRSHGTPVRSVVFSPNEKSLAAAFGDGTLALWRTEDGEAIRTLQGSGAPADMAVLSRNGSHLAAGGADGAVKIWKCE